MSLLSIALVIIVVGVLLWLVERFIPMDATIKKLLVAVVVIILIIWLLGVFGVMPEFLNIRVGK